MRAIAGVDQPEYPELLSQLMRLFSSADDITSWGGPEFRFPFDQTSFESDAKLDQMDCVWLLDHHGQLAAFGQSYERLGCCHFARLVVAPTFRGQGCIEQLMEELELLAKSHFGFSELSLFVLETNHRARRVYERLGYSYLDYPEPNPGFPDGTPVLYMRKQCAQL